MLVGGTFKLAIEDLKAFYLEAATSEPGARSVDAVNDWFWSQTAAAELLWDLRARLGEHDNEGIKAHAAFTLVPGIATYPRFLPPGQPIVSSQNPAQTIAIALSREMP